MLSNNIYQLKCNILEICKKNGRRAEEVSFVAVTKNSELLQIQEAYELGCRDFGENRLQDALLKIEKMPKDCRWHFLGRLQSNKILKIIENFYLIHSVPDLDTAELISKTSYKLDKQTSILLQVNTSNEKSKSGDSIEIWRENAEKLLNLSNIKICGLMTMAPLSHHEDVIRKTFSRLNLFFKEIQTTYPELATFKILSMGMSSDYKIAIEEGATQIRVGSLLFNSP